MRIMTALTRVALACGAALVMATAALGALHTAEREPVVERATVPARPVVVEPTIPSISEFELGTPPEGVRATR